MAKRHVNNDLISAGDKLADWMIKHGRTEMPVKAAVDKATTLGSLQGDWVYNSIIKVIDRSPRFYRPRRGVIAVRRGSQRSVSTPPSPRREGHGEVISKGWVTVRTDYFKGLCERVRVAERQLKRVRAAVKNK